MSNGRGMGLETLIEYTNNLYRGKRLAAVEKRAIPVTITKKHGNGRIEGYLEKASTVDFDGVYRGKSLQFEAKSTRDPNRIPLDNFHKHQIEHMRLCLEQNAITFCIIEFVKRDIRFYVPAKIVIDAWDKALKGGPKSIAFDDLNFSCYTIPSSRGVPVDYLSVVDKLMEAKSNVSVPGL